MEGKDWTLSQTHAKFDQGQIGNGKLQDLLKLHSCDRYKV